jgi:hypothetical protein
MTLKRIALGFFALATLGSTSALAAPPDIAARQTEVKTALNGLNLNLAGDATSFDARGRRDLVVRTNAQHGALVSQLKTAYLQRTALPNGYIVAGYSKQARTGKTTFTMRNLRTNDRYMAVVTSDAAGSQVKILGRNLNPNRPVKSWREVPHRYGTVQ